MTTRRTQGGDSHGPARLPRKVADFRTLTTDDIDRLMRSAMIGVQRSVAKSQAWYLNARAQRGLSDAAPTYVLSDFRFKDFKFPTSWMAPRPRGFRVTRQGVIRPWQFIALHCFGEGVDKNHLTTHRGSLSLPTDADGYNPSRFIAAMRELTLWDKGRGVASVHFAISRRGDFVSSVDLNDIANTTKPDVPFPFGSLNRQCIGIELESHLARYIPSSSFTRTDEIYRQPYTQKQLLCLAIALRKLHSWRSVFRIEWLSTRSAIIAAYNNGTGGCLQHRDVAPSRKTDPGAQFNIPAGTRAAFGSPMWNGTGTSRNGPGPMMESGWDQLDGFFQTIRAVNPATQAFQIPLTPSKIALARASEIMGLASHEGQRTAARVARNRLAGLSRSEQMQGQSRRALYALAAANNQSLAGLIGKATAVTSSVIRRFDLSVVKGVENAVTYNEETGLWEDGSA